MSLTHDYVTKKQAAEHLQVSTKTIERWSATGTLEAHQLTPGGTVRISATSIEKLLEKTRQKISHPEVK